MWIMNTPNVYGSYGSLTTYAIDAVAARANLIDAIITQSIYENIGYYGFSLKSWNRLTNQNESMISPLEWVKTMHIERIEHSVILHAWTES
jgi:hypothetical protein